MLIILAVIEIVFLMLTFASNIRAKIGPDPYALFLLISANLTFVVAWLGIKLALADRTLDRSLRALHSGLRDVSNTRSGVVTLFDHDFYDRFAKAMRDATNRETREADAGGVAEGRTNPTPTISSIRRYFRLSMVSAVRRPSS